MKECINPNDCACCQRAKTALKEAYAATAKANARIAELEFKRGEKDGRRAIGDLDELADATAHKMSAEGYMYLYRGYLFSMQAMAEYGNLEGLRQLALDASSVIVGYSIGVNEHVLRR